MKANGQAKVQKLKAFPSLSYTRTTIEEKKFRMKLNKNVTQGKVTLFLFFLETLTTLTVIVHSIATFYMHNVAKATTGSLISATSLRG